MHMLLETAEKGPLRDREKSTEGLRNVHRGTAKCPQRDGETPAEGPRTSRWGTEWGPLRVERNPPRGTARPAEGLRKAHWGAEEGLMRGQERPAKGRERSAKGPRMGPHRARERPSEAERMVHRCVNEHVPVWKYLITNKGLISVALPGLKCFFQNYTGTVMIQIRIMIYW